MNRCGVIAVALCAVILSACSTVESDIKEFVKCSFGARNLGYYDAAKIIDAKMDAYMRENNVNMSSRDIMYLSEEIREELGVFNQGPDNPLRELAAAKIFNSGYCVDIHEMDEIDDLPVMYYVMYIFL